MKFSEVVKECLETENIKIIELSKMIGFSNAYTADLIKGNRRWNETTIDKVSKALGIVVIYKISKKSKLSKNLPKDTIKQKNNQSA